MEYGDDGSQGSYHTPKLGEENMVPVPVLEPILPPTDLSLLLSDQENILLRMVTPPPFTGGKGPNISGHMLNTLRIQSISDHNVSSGQKSDTFKMYPVM